MKTLALIAAAVVLPLTLSAPAPAEAQQNGHTYTNVSHSREHRPAYRRGTTPRQYAYNNQGRNDRRDYRNRNDRRRDYGRNDRRRDDRRRYSSRNYRWNPYGWYNNTPRRVQRHAYRAPSHRNHVHKHKRWSRSDIRRHVQRYYPSVFRMEFGNGVYDVWARDRHGTAFRLGYDAYTGAFLTFFHFG